MPESNLPDHSCRLRRRSSAFHSVPGNDLPISISARQTRGSQSTFAEHQVLLSAVAALERKLSRLSPSSDGALDLIAQEALALTNAHGAAIALEFGQEVLCCARAGRLGPPLGTVIDGASGLCGECLRTGEVVRCDDTETDARVDISVSQQTAIRSVLSVPIHLDDGIIGIFAVFSAAMGAFGDSDARLLQSLAELSAKVERNSLAEQGIGETKNGPIATGFTSPDRESRLSLSTPGRFSPARSSRISKSLDKIRQDRALRLLGRAKAYLTIETLHDGSDRSHPISLIEELMLQRVAEIGVDVHPASS